MNDPASTSTAEPLTKLSPLLEPFLLLLEKPFKLPICRGCQAAILPKSLMDHFRKHHELPVESRKAMKSLVTVLPPLDFDDIPNNPDGSTPVEVLRVVDAFQCKHCPFIRRDVTDVRKHINTEHNLSAAGSYSQIEAQSWFGGRRAVYWRVCVGSIDTVKDKSEQSSMPITDSDFDLSGFSGCRWGLFGVEWGFRNPTGGSG